MRLKYLRLTASYRTVNLHEPPGRSTIVTNRNAAVPALVSSSRRSSTALLTIGASVTQPYNPLDVTEYRQLLFGGGVVCRHVPGRTLAWRNTDPTIDSHPTSLIQIIIGRPPIHPLQSWWHSASQVECTRGEVNCRRFHWVPRRRCPLPTAVPETPVLHLATAVEATYR